MALGKEAAYVYMDFWFIGTKQPTVWIGYQPITGLPLQIVRFPWGSVNKKQNYMELFSQKKKKEGEDQI